MKHYCVGFAFYKSEVLLILKDRPDFQKGKLNGIGGSIEPNETSVQAMVREFKEGTSVYIPDNEWIYNGHLNDTVLSEAKVDVYCTLLNEEKYQQLKHVELQGLKLSKNEPLRFINVFEELVPLDNRNLLMYNIKDIVYKLFKDYVSTLGFYSSYAYFIPIPLTWNYIERLTK